MGLADRLLAVTALGLAVLGTWWLVQGFVHSLGYFPPLAIVGLMVLVVAIRVAWSLPSVARTGEFRRGYARFLLVIEGLATLFNFLGADNVTLDLRALLGDGTPYYSLDMGVSWYASLMAIPLLVWLLIRDAGRARLAQGRHEATGDH